MFNIQFWSMQLNLICETKHLSSNKILPRHYKVPIHRHKSKSQIPTPNQHNIKEPNKMKKIREQNEKKNTRNQKTTFTVQIHCESSHRLQGYNKWLMPLNFFFNWTMEGLVVYLIFLLSILVFSILVLLIFSYLKVSMFCVNILWIKYILH